MEIAMIGLGKMGANMTTRLLGKGHRVVAFDVKEEAVRSAEAGGAIGARTLDEAVGKLSAPRAVKIARRFGKDFLTYVLWAVSVDGEAMNLGEITFDATGPVSINVTTPSQTFSSLVHPVTQWASAVTVVFGRAMNSSQVKVISSSTSPQMRNCHVARSILGTRP